MPRNLFAVPLGILFGVVTLLGCPGDDGDLRFDFDRDGHEDASDCGPEDNAIYPGAQDPFGDGIDQDCDGYDGVDGDGDGYPSNVAVDDSAYDCDDSDLDVHPGADEVVNDGIDNDCDGSDDTDADGDGHIDGLDDCDDGDANVYLGAEELADCLDNDCDAMIDEGTVTADDDGDGFCEGLDLGSGLQCCDGNETGDCDDENPLLHAADGDGDGYSPCDGDCDDFAASRSPGLAEVCDGLDNDCDLLLPADEQDVDGDGYRACIGDCDDTDPGTYPAATESADGVDNDCDGLIDEGTEAYDDDHDGWSEQQGDCDDTTSLLHPGDLDGDGFSPCQGDCSDYNASVHVGHVELCDGLDNDCDNVLPPAEQDADGDGFWPCLGDCDDAASHVYPLAVEQIDCLDNDCDGAVDEGLATVDGDGDGYCVGVDLGQGLQCCDGSTPGDCDDDTPMLHPGDADGDGISSCSGDCDDFDPGRYPGKAEGCDGLDSDCDGSIPLEEQDIDQDGAAPCQADCDDADPDLNPFDLDGDGYTTCHYPEDCDDDPLTGAALNHDDLDGDEWSTCSVPPDCDDEDAATHPAAVEICDDMDNDCDGALPLAESDSDGDGVTECGGDCDDSDSTYFPGQWEPNHDSLDQNCDGEDFYDLGQCPIALRGVTTWDQSGWSVAGGQDLDGDGIPDILIGAPGNENLAPDGLAYVVHGRLADWPASLADADGIIAGSGAEELGKAVALAGDVDDDGLGDLLIGAPGADDDTGAAYLVLGRAGSWPSAAADADAIFAGPEMGALGGCSVAAAGDVDADGFADMLVGAEGAQVQGTARGAAYLILGRDTGWPAALNDADAIFAGETTGDLAGRAVASAGDVNGDQIDDILVGAPNSSFTGKAYLLFGRVGSWPSSLDQADVIFDGESSGDYAGEGVGSAGDVDGDGYGDLLVAATHETDIGIASGKIYLVLGRSSGWPTSLADAELAIRGEQWNDRVGIWVGAVGDVNGDGLGDFAAGTPEASEYWTSRGKAYVTLGRTAGWEDNYYNPDALTFIGDGYSGARAARGISTAGDINGDGLDDLLIGVYGNNDLATNAGKTCVLLSPFGEVGP